MSNNERKCSDHWWMWYYKGKYVFSCLCCWAPVTAPPAPPSPPSLRWNWRGNSKHLTSKTVCLQTAREGYNKDGGKWKKKVGCAEIMNHHQLGGCRGAQETPTLFNLFIWSLKGTDQRTFKPKETLPLLVKMRSTQQKPKQLDRCRFEVKGFLWLQWFLPLQSLYWTSIQLGNRKNQTESSFGHKLWVSLTLAEVKDAARWCSPKQTILFCFSICGCTDF